MFLFVLGIWSGHLQCYLPISIENGTQQLTTSNQVRSGYRPEKGQLKRWIKNIKDILNIHRYNAAEATHLALEQKLILPPKV